MTSAGRFLTVLAASLVAVGTWLVASSRPARADRVHDLAAELVAGKKVKTRVAAAVSLGRLRDPRSLKPLTRALRDHSREVRAVAASALGSLGDPAALPALQQARRDSSPQVRHRADQAIAQIRDEEEARSTAAAAPSTSDRAPAARPIHVTLKSATDETAGPIRHQIRRARVAEMRSLMIDWLAQGEDVVLISSSSRDRSVDPYAIDVTLVKLARETRGRYVEIGCEIRVAISTPKGKMLSLLTGGAKVQVPRATFRSEFLPEVQREALEGAVRSVHRELVTYLGGLQHAPSAEAAASPDL